MTRWPETVILSRSVSAPCGPGGAPGQPGGGAAFVYSGRTYGLLYRIDPPDATHRFGFGTGSTKDVDGDRIPDLVVGGHGTTYVFSGRDRNSG